MLAELIQVTTSDAVRLHGALHLPPSGGGKFQGDADLLICVHGAGGNFYASPPFTGLARILVDRGLAVLRVNTRGHDGLANVAGAGLARRQGAACEIVDECRHDLHAWVNNARERGFKRLVLAGHSLGGIKVIHAAANHPPIEVGRIVAISPACLSYARFIASSHGKEFRQTLAHAESLVADGRPNELLEVKFPISLVISAYSYLDKYGPQERYNILRQLKYVSSPMLITFGGLELGESPAFAGLPEEIAKLNLADRITTNVIPAANHLYSGSIATLAGIIENWLAS